MLDFLLQWSLRNRVITLFFALLLLLGGGYAATRMPVDVFPDLTAPTVTILTDAHGMATEEVETLVTFPIETAVNGATGVRRVRSSTTQGFSIVWVEFDWGQDIFRARQVVSEKLQLVALQLPAGASQPTLAPITSIMGEIMMIALASDVHSPLEVRATADWVVRKRLLAVPGVAQVVPNGGEVKQYQVLVHPEQLRAFDVPLDAVLTAARDANAIAAGGVYHAAGQEILIRGLGRVRQLEDIAQTVVAVRDGTPILLHDVADVVIGPEPRFGTASVNAEPAVVLTIQKQPDANTLELTRRIDAELDRIETGLPDGMTINRAIFRQSTFISVAVDNVIEALRDGAILVIVILFLFLWNIRTTAISVLAIPLSLLTAIVIMRLFGITINTMTLGGMAIAVGALVDDAIIAVENIFQRLKQNTAAAAEQQQPVGTVVFDAAREVMGPIVNATLVITIVFVPLFFLSGVEGRMFRPLGFAYVVSILASLLVAVTVTPVLSFYLLPDAPFVKRGGESWLVGWLKQWYSRILDRWLERPLTVAATAAGAVVATLLVLPLLGRGFLPEFQEGALTLTAVTVPGTNIEESDLLGSLVERRLLTHPAVLSTARRTGRGELDEHGQGVNGAEIEVMLDLSYGSQRDITAELRRLVTAVPGMSITFGQPIGHRIDHMLSGTRAAIAVKVFGSDLYELRRIGEAIRTAVEDIPGVVDLSVEQQADVPQLRVRADRQAMARYGVTAGQLAEAIDVAFYGAVVSQVLEGQNMFDLVVRFEAGHRSTAEQIRSALVDTPVGAKVPLALLADIVEDRGPNTISREAVQRKLVVQANVVGGDIAGAVEEMRARIAQTVELDEGYYVEFGGQFESGFAAARLITLLSGLSVAVIFLILFQEFGTVRSALLIMVNLPLALIGGVFAILASQNTLNVATLVGFVTLFGIAVRNGILLVSNYNQLIDQGLPLYEAVYQGSLQRLNPILMTALTAALALLPLALGGGEPGKEIEAPMAIVVLGGLLTSTALNMVVVPTLFLRFGVRKPRVQS
ncbi:MAG: multidrug transporter AcrB [Gemmatimonas sp. SG8_17]|nr:MAG: multidrug transporter AcrB [Gemmatimonas sp. SG8_17]